MMMADGWHSWQIYGFENRSPIDESRRRADQNKNNHDDQCAGKTFFSRSEF